MAGTAVPRRLTWLLTTVTSKRRETDRAVTLALESPEWPGHLAGQHIDVRLTADDGYQAERSYSIASAPEVGKLELTIEQIADGEVSPYLTEELRDGDQLELRGPIGGYFTWREAEGGPLLLVAGGSGVVPLMSILRYRQAVGSSVPTTILYSARSWEDIIYRDELEHVGKDDGVNVAYTLTRSQPAGWPGFTRRVDAKMLQDVGALMHPDTRAYVCGPTPLVESVATDLVALGYPPERVKTERFGPTGG
jgi:ferredoxin-NADP reductase